MKSIQRVIHHPDRLLKNDRFRNISCRRQLADMTQAVLHPPAELFLESHISHGFQEKIRVESSAHVGIPLQAPRPLTSKSGLADCDARTILQLCQPIRVRANRIRDIRRSRHQGSPLNMAIRSVNSNEKRLFVQRIWIRQHSFRSAVCCRSHQTCHYRSVHRWFRAEGTGNGTSAE
jgi:hypothetical protein